MKIASWNVNSINMRLPHVLNWIKAETPDVLLLQELKTVTENFPAAELEAAGYHTAVQGQKSWNGVAILSRHPISDIKVGLPGDDADEQARYIEGTIKGIRVCCLYLPNGNPVDTEKYPYKLKWMDRLIVHARRYLAGDVPFVLGGDFNIIPEDRDCHDPRAWSEDALFRLESRKKWRTLLYSGLTDAFRVFNNKDHQYTFWDYQGGAFQRNNGIRIDHFLTSPAVTDRLLDCRIDAAPRAAEKASDHTPVYIHLKD